MTSRSRSSGGPSEREDEADEKRNAKRVKAEEEPKWCAGAARNSGSRPAVGRLISVAARAGEDYRSRRSL